VAGLGPEKRTKKVSREKLVSSVEVLIGESKWNGSAVGKGYKGKRAKRRMEGEEQS